jgi:hypothetical protein
VTAASSGALVGWLVERQLGGLVGLIAAGTVGMLISVVCLLAVDRVLNLGLARRLRSAYPGVATRFGLARDTA